MDLQQQNARAPQPRRGGGFSAQSSFLFHLMVILFVDYMNILLIVMNILLIADWYMVYWRGDTLLKTVTDPGVHLKLPLIYFEPIQVTLQTHQFCDIPCGTKDDVMINIEKIQIDEKLREALQDDSAHYAPGIEIISVRVTRHTIPDSVRHKFEQMGEEHPKTLLSSCALQVPKLYGRHVKTEAMEGSAEE